MSGITTMNKTALGLLGAFCMSCAWLPGVVAQQTVDGDTLTIDGEIVAIGNDADLGAAVTNVVLTNEGGVRFTNSVSSLKKNFRIDGTGVVSVDAGRTVYTDNTNRLVVGTLGQTLVKRGPGALQLNRGPKKVTVPTRWIVEEGELYELGDDYFGNHSGTTTNLTIDVREGAVFHTDGCHCPMGPLELTGGAMTRDGNTVDSNWGNTAFRGGVVAHACARESRIAISGHAHLNHVYTNVPFVVESGATLVVRGRLSNGYNAAASARIPNRLEVSGGGSLRLFSKSVYTGGTKVSDGTKLTLAHAEALGTGPLEIDGEVTFEILPGVTYACPGISGTGKIVKIGKGAFACGSLPEGVAFEEREPATLGGDNPIVDGLLHLNGSVVVVSVAAGEDLTIDGFVDSAGSESAATEIVKTGAGTLVLPEGSATRYGKLTVKGGFVAVRNEASFGSDVVTLQDGGGLRIAASFSQQRACVVCSGAATLDVPAGVTFGVTSNRFVSTGATVTKTGAGQWALKSDFRSDRGVAFAGTRWVVHEGVLKLGAGDAFGGHTTACPLVLEAHEGARIELNNSNVHTPICNVVLRGATLFGYYGQFGTTTYSVEGGSRWHGFGLNGPITVEPSSDGRPSTICARACHLAHGSKATVFDVKDGATLVVDTALNPGWNNGCNARNESGLVKTGGGTLKLLRQVGAKGVFDIRGGTVSLGPKAALNDNLQLSVSPAAKLAMDDGAQIVAPTSAESALCSLAEVWFDASRLAAEDGSAVSSLPNYGTAGGTFGVVKCLNNYTPTAPTFVKSGIGGRGCLMFDGSQSLVTTAHTNKGVRMQVFLVSKWTSWQKSGGFGLYGGPFSMMSKKGEYASDKSGDDNECYGSLAYNNWDGTVADLKTCTRVSTVSMNPSGISVGAPYITHSGYDKEALRFYSEVWNGVDSKARTNTLSSTAVNCNVDTVCIGGRLRLGVPQIWGKDHGNNRQYIGQVGEVLVFTRNLSEEETATVYAYLKRKWFGTGAETRDGSASRLTVEVSEGASAGYAANLSVSTATTPIVVKTGPGSLRLGCAFAGEAQVAVEQGGLELDDHSRSSQVDVWVDASDSTGMAFDSEGRVTNLVNRGSCGGAFARNARRTPAPFGPQWTEDGINGVPALVFDGDSALALESYRNTTSPRRLSVYFVGVRTRWDANPNDPERQAGWGRWAGPWCLGYTKATASDESVPGVCHVEEDTANGAYVDFGNATTGRVTPPPTAEPYLMVFHAFSNMVMVAYETNATAVTAVPQTAVGAAAEPLNIDIVQLAARTAAGGGSQWYGHDNCINRMWYGKIGEFIVTSEPLAYQQEVELFAYLRKKWFDKGTGSATPPAWLTGAVARPELGDKTLLTMADGTTLRHAAASMTLGGLETAGTVSWTREWDGDLSTFPLFEVGEVSLGSVQLCPKPAVRKGWAKVLGYGEAVGTPSWQVFRPDGKPRPAAQVTDRGDGYWLLDQVGLLLFVK